METSINDYEAQSEERFDLTMAKLRQEWDLNGTESYATGLCEIAQSTQAVEAGHSSQIHDAVTTSPTLDDLRRQLLVVGNNPPSGNVTRTIQANRLADLISQQEIEFFHCSSRTPFASIKVGEHFENWEIDGPQFRHYLHYLYYRNFNATPNANAMKEAISLFQGKALFEGQQYEVYNRLAPTERGLVLDLGNEEWSAVEVDDEGWRVVKKPTVKFARNGETRALPIPESGGDPKELLEVVNLRPEDWPLLAGWMMSMLKPDGPYPVLALCGEQGSAKSTLTRFVKSLVDPSATTLRAMPRNHQDLMIAAKRNWVLAFDNLTGIRAEMSDALCTLSTGGGFAGRRLYANDEETTINARRPVILNGIDELATRGDLLDRTITLYIPTIPQERRRSEQELTQQFEAMRPRMLGALLDATVLALQGQEPARRQLDGRLPRMADFAVWAVASERGLGLNDGDFMQAYERNRDIGAIQTISGNPVATIVIALMGHHNGFWRGTATELLATLNQMGRQEIQHRTFPRTANILGNTLRRLSPNLSIVGIHCENQHTNRGSVWTIRQDQAQE